MNRAILMGNVGRDPEIRLLNSGERVANLSLATSETWRDKATGEKRERTEWHRIVAFGAVVDVIEKHVKKGSKLAIEGSIQTRKWTDQAGVEKYSTEIKLDRMHFAGSADRNESGGDETPARQQQTASRKAASSSVDDDDIPF